MANSDLEAMAKTLEGSGLYRVLRKLVAPQLSPPTGKKGDKIAVFVDVETTGLDPAKDEIIELGIVKFSYSPDGEVNGVIDSIGQLRQPSFPIPELATSITGITNEMVVDHQIDEAEINQLVDDADLVIAHNAAFDRRFLERLIPLFMIKPWACSMSEVDWVANGYEGTKLAYLAAEAGFFFDRHRAENDCLAAIELLSRTLPNGNETGLSAMLRNARKATWRIWAEGAPFECKDALKARGYRWNSDDNSQPRAWYVDVYEDAKESELSYLIKEIYRTDRQLASKRITAFERYSDRI